MDTDIRRVQVFDGQSGPLQCPPSPSVLTSPLSPARNARMTKSSLICLLVSLHPDTVCSWNLADWQYLDGEVVL